MMNVTDAIERLREPALAEMREMLGAEYAPGYMDTYYKVRVQNGDPVSHYERRLLAILDDMPARSYHEIGGGIGILPIALGIMGREAVNIDAFAWRIKCGQRIISTLGDAGLTERVKMVCALVPEAFNQIDTTDAVAVTTNVGAARPQEFIDGFLRDIAARYKAYVFDLCLLWGTYETEPKWCAHLAHIAEIWGREPELLFAAGDRERYYLVRFDR